uniref:Uncharacterized protein n=1 Tax=Rhizophora mucronata TaxID=61149 RepID=A0A2P2Q5V1_RHIMU
MNSLFTSPFCSQSLVSVLKGKLSVMVTLLHV